METAMTRRLLGYAIPATAAALLAVSLSHAREGEGERFEVLHVTAADGTGGAAADLGRIQAGYDRTLELLRKKAQGMYERTRELKTQGHHAGLPSCRVRGEREVRLKETVPPRFRSLTLYFVRVPKGGVRPGILPEALPRDGEVFALDAEALSDVAALSRTLARRVSLGTKEFAQAMGAACVDARITFSSDGTTAIVREGAP
jgi:hypothetical protein